MNARKPQDFQGVLFDCIEEVVIERAPCLRGSYAEAMEDARKLVGVVNRMAEDADDDDSTIGRVDESYCFVLVNGVIAYDEAEAA